MTDAAEVFITQWILPTSNFIMKSTADDEVLGELAQFEGELAGVAITPTPGGGMCGSISASVSPFSKGIGDCAIAYACCSGRSASDLLQRFLTRVSAAWHTSAWLVYAS
ncbi:hypothetical protein [Plasticicumulans acidivorans]|uniref:hypothetical protein n=1 Tax=Plasticicumulans acidivorans TaxID=886464 RepID=UPI0011B74EF4|nr:hypothetical protein [Plasticicumulans acidivorans]